MSKPVTYYLEFNKVRYPLGNYTYTPPQDDDDDVFPEFLNTKCRSLYPILNEILYLTATGILKKPTGENIVINAPSNHLDDDFLYDANYDILENLINDGASIISKLQDGTESALIYSAPDIPGALYGRKISISLFGNGEFIPFNED